MILLASQNIYGNLSICRFVLFLTNDRLRKYFGAYINLHFSIFFSVSCMSFEHKFIILITHYSFYRISVLLDSLLLIYCII